MYFDWTSENYIMDAFLKSLYRNSEDIDEQASSIPETTVWLALVVGFGTTVAFWLLNIGIEFLWPYSENTEAVLQTFQARLFHRGIIPFFILWAFSFGMYLLWQVFHRQYKYIKGSRNRQKDLINTALERGITDRRRLKEIDEKVKIKVQELYNPAETADQGRSIQKVEGFYEEKFVKLFAMRDSNLIDYIKDYKNEWLANDEGDIAVSFTPVRFSEWSLPLLGFLGTVLGIASSITNMKGGVELLFESGKFTPDIQVFFNEGFLNLALAFDTTFLGLFFLIIVGSLHYLLRNAIAKELSFANDLFTHVIGSWQAVIEASTIRAIESLHDTAIDTFIELESGNEYKKKHDEFVLDVFEKIINEADGEVFTNIREVLFSRVIEASADIGIHIEPELMRLQQTLGIRQLKIQEVAVSASASNKAVLSIYDDANKNANYLQLISITEQQENLIYCPLTYKAQKVAIDYFGNVAITQDEEGNLHWIKTSEINPETSQSSFLQIAPNGDWVVPIRLKNTARFLILYKGPAESQELEYQCETYALDSTGEPSRKSVDEISSDLAIELRNKIYQVATNGSNVVALHFYDEEKNKGSKEKNESIIQVCTLELKDERETGDEGIAVRGTEEKSRTVKVLSLKTLVKDRIAQKIRQLTFISENELVYLTEENRLHYFNINSGYIIKVGRVRFTEDALLSQGTFSHFAVAQRDKLMMYRAKYGNAEPVIVEYGVSAGGDKDYFRVEGGLAVLTSPPNGQLAVGLSSSRRELFVWRFPQNYLDFKKSTLPRN